MYRNSRLKHVKKIREICERIRENANHFDSEVYMENSSNGILDQCTLLLEKKKRKKCECVCHKQHELGEFWICKCNCKKKSKYSLPNEKEILGMLDGLHVCKGDGNVYLSYPPKWKCKTCGKFFTEQLPS